MRSLRRCPLALLAAGLILIGCGDDRARDQERGEPSALQDGARDQERGAPSALQDGARDQDQVRASALKMLDAIERKDPTGFCAQLEPRSRQNFGANAGVKGQNQLIPGCEEAAQIIFQASGDQKAKSERSRQQIQSGKVTIKGDTATIKTESNQPPLVLHRVDGRWLVEINS